MFVYWEGMESQNKLLKKMQKPSTKTDAPPSHPKVTEIKFDLWQLVNLQDSPTKMSFQVNQLSSASSSSINNEKITTPDMNDQEPQFEQELVNIAAAEKQSGTEY